jgi:hypothetical protein
MTALGLAHSNGHRDIVETFKAARQPGDCWFTQQSQSFEEKKQLRDAFHARIEKFNKNQEAKGKRVHATPGQNKTTCPITHTKGAIVHRSEERERRMEIRLEEIPDNVKQQYKDHGLRTGVMSPSKNIESIAMVHTPWYKLDKASR